jgi:uncharacterized protein
LAAVLAFAMILIGPVHAKNLEPISAAFLEAEGLDLNTGNLAAGAEKKILGVPAGLGPIKAFFSLLLGVYRNGITPVDGPTCAFEPTCSGYSREALHRHGVARGILMTGDRLLRCNGYDKSAYPMVGLERRYFDPVP